VAQPRSPEPDASRKPPAKAECQQLLARMSIGEPTPELLDRYKTLGCR
jgi:hypothetical protein